MLEAIGVLAGVVSTIVAVMTFVRDGRRGDRAAGSVSEPSVAAYQPAPAPIRVERAARRPPGSGGKLLAVSAVVLTILTVVMVFIHITGIALIVGVLALIQWILLIARSARRAQA